MISELWNRFPRLLENNINGLLEGARPTRMKAFHLYKTCKSDGLWKESFEEFSTHLEEFFLKHKELLRGKVIIYKEVEFWDAV